MAADLGSIGRPSSALSSGRSSPIPRTDDGNALEVVRKDKAFRRYASTVSRALSLFDSSLQEWADYISFLGRLLKALQSHPPDVNIVPSKRVVAKRLAQCLNPSLPSGVHQKALEIYGYIFGVIGEDGLSRDLCDYLPGLCPVLDYASLTIRPLYLSLLETYVVKVDPSALRPALKAIILALLPGLEEETSEDFERVLSLLEKFRAAANADPEDGDSRNSSGAAGGEYFWQCFFLSSMASSTRRQGVLAFLARRLPRLADPSLATQTTSNDAQNPSQDARLPASVEAVLVPEPGLLVRCFATGLADEQLLVQRGFLDLLVTHLPLHSHVFRNSVSPPDQQRLVSAAIGVVTRREMSLNRRLWAWLLGPDPTGGARPDIVSRGHQTANGDAKAAETPSMQSRPAYFQRFGFKHVVASIRNMLGQPFQSSSDRTRPFRVCLSLMDCSEVGTVVIPEVLILALGFVRSHETQSTSKEEVSDVLRSARVFFDAVDGSIICGEILKLLSLAITNAERAVSERMDDLALVKFIVTHFNFDDDELRLIHIPLVNLALVAMLEVRVETHADHTSTGLGGEASPYQAAFVILEILVGKVPESAYLEEPEKTSGEAPFHAPPSSPQILQNVERFYAQLQEDVGGVDPPFTTAEVGRFLLYESTLLLKRSLEASSGTMNGKASVKLFVLVLGKIAVSSPHTSELFAMLENAVASSMLDDDSVLPFSILWLLVDAVVLLRKRAAQQVQPSLSSTQVVQLLPVFMKVLWAYLSPVHIKHHIESVQCIWKLQATMPYMDRTIEACISTFMVSKPGSEASARNRPDAEQKFALLWTHSLQSRSRMFDPKSDLARGLEHVPLRQQYSTERSRYQVMLSRPLFLLLDALSEEGTERFVWARSWLQSLPDVHKLLRLIAGDILGFSLHRSKAVGATDSRPSPPGPALDEPDDLEPCIYYFETLLNVCRWCANDTWVAMATESIGNEDQVDTNFLVQGEFRPDSTILAFYAQMCIRVVQSTQDGGPSGEASTYFRLQRIALSTLQLLLATPPSSSLLDLHLERPLLDLLLALLKQPDPPNQTSALDTAFAALNLQRPPEIEAHSTSQNRRGSKEIVKSPRSSLSIEQEKAEAKPFVQQPPSQLGRCLLAGFSSASSRPILDSWVNFLAACLPLFSNTIYQVLIPLVECLCEEVGHAFGELKTAFSSQSPVNVTSPDTRMAALLTALELTLTYAHGALRHDQTRVASPRSAEQPGFFNNMVSGVFNSDTLQSKNAAGNNRLSVLLSLHDTVRISFDIWSWTSALYGQTDADASSRASLLYTSTRIRNKARRLLERLFAMEPVECPEILIALWCTSPNVEAEGRKNPVIDLLHVLDGSRPKVTFSAVFIAIQNRTNPQTSRPLRKSALTAQLTDTDLISFLSEYARFIDDDATDEIWADCLTFLREVLANPFPHRQIIPKLLEFTATLGGKMDNTSFGDNRMRRELSDLFVRLLTAAFTTKPMAFLQETPQPMAGGRLQDRSRGADRSNRQRASGTVDIIAILTSIVPRFGNLFAEPERSLAATQIISTGVLAPAFRSKIFPDNLPTTVLELLRELSRLPNAQKLWKKDVADAFNHARFISSTTEVVKTYWLPLIRQWATGDKERMPELLSRLTPPTTAGIVFGVGASSARLDADRKAQLNLRRIALLVLASAPDTYIANLASLEGKLEELFTSTTASSPSCATRADVFMVLRAIVLRSSSSYLFSLWSVISSELQTTLGSIVDEEKAANFNDAAILQACKLLDTLVLLAPEEFQQMEWLFVTDSIDAVYRPAVSGRRPIALVDRLAEVLGEAASSRPVAPQSSATATDAESNSQLRKPLLGLMQSSSYANRDELTHNVVQPFFSQLSIIAFENTYSAGTADLEACESGLLADLLDERSVVGD